MRKYNLKTSTFGALLLISAILTLSPAAHAERYYTNSDMPGFWWGKDPQEEEIQEKKPQPPPPPPPKPKQEEPRKEQKWSWSGRQELRFNDFTPEELWDMPTQEMKDLVDAFRQQAVRRPSEQHGLDDLRMLDMARRKALAYTNVHEYVLAKYPELSMNKDYPTNAPAREVLRQISQNDAATSLAAARENFALIYFYRNDCQYCVAQDGILNNFMRKRQWRIKAVNISENPSMAARFDISTTPTLLLVKKGMEDAVPISVGVISIQELETRLVSAVAILNGEGSPEQYTMQPHQRGGVFDPLAPLQKGRKK